MKAIQVDDWKKGCAGSGLEGFGRRLGSQQAARQLRATSPTVVPLRKVRQHISILGLVIGHAFNQGFGLPNR
eukprot:12874627-Alexandrium_andersonii.AAC.1